MGTPERANARTLRARRAWFGAARARAAVSARDLYSSFLAAERKPGGVGLQALAANDRLLQRFTRPTPTFLRAGFVHFVGTLGCVREDQHFVAGDLQEPAADRHRFLGTALLDADDPRLKRG
jgi:hypothetical protein